MTDKDIALPNNILIDEGFFNGFIDKKAAANYVEKLIEDGIVTLEQSDDLILGLNHAAKYYFMGKSLEEGVKSNLETKKEILRKRQNKLIKELKDLPGIDQMEMPIEEALETFAKSLKTPPRGKPKQHSIDGFVWIMCIVWQNYLGYYLGTASGENDQAESRVVQFCNNWIKIIDPNRAQLPMRHKYRSIIGKFKLRES